MIDLVWSVVEYHHMLRSDFMTLFTLTTIFFISPILLSFYWLIALLWMIWKKVSLWSDFNFKKQLLEETRLILKFLMGSCLKVFLKPRIEAIYEALGYRVPTVEIADEFDLDQENIEIEADIDSLIHFMECVYKIQYFIGILFIIGYFIDFALKFKNWVTFNGFKFPKNLNVQNFVPRMNDSNKHQENICGICLDNIAEKD